MFCVNIIYKFKILFDIIIGEKRGNYEPSIKDNTRRAKKPYL